VTVIGNLVDNALDAVTGAPDRRVRLVATRRGGAVSYRAENGAVFEAVLPVDAPQQRAPDEEETHV
jgi:sensor histidine kinase regulating citrate/malate metabolism